MTRGDAGGRPWILEADGIGRSFGRLDALKAASLRAERGAVTALVGRNGAGKTTLLRIVVGRVRADRGRVLYDGVYHPRPRLAVLARGGLMYLGQGSGLTRLFTVREHLDAVASRFGREGEVASLVRRMDLGEILARPPDAVSGGERRRASLALALLREPRCLLVDEPFAGVAPRDRPLIASALTGLAKDGCAVVITGHDVEDVFAVSDTVFWAVAGVTHELGSPEAARRHHQFRREYLGPRLPPHPSPTRSAAPPRDPGA